jgi:hypothetical protein
MKKYLLYASFTAVLIGGACDDFGDINESPNASKTPLTSALLASSLSQLGTSVTGGPALVSGFYAQYFSQTQYTENSLYTEQDANWSTELAGPINDLNKIIEINSDKQTAPLAATQGSNNNQIAIARILKAYRYSVLTDRYGDMPYSEALHYDNLTPTFDKQQDIYNDLFKELDEASLQFDDGATVKGDILFKGNVSKWQKFANSWRLVLALRLSQVDESWAKQQFLDALTNNGSISSSTISSNADNVELTYPGGAFKNPWFAIAADQGVSNTIANILNNTSDRRRLAFGNAAANGTLLGFDYGLTRDDAIVYGQKFPTWSLILNNSYRAEASKFFVFTYADVLLARVEAAVRGWTTEDANSLFQEAIRASWEQWNVFIAPDPLKTEAELLADANLRLTNYLNGIAFNPAAPDALEKIGIQRWIAFYPNGPQGWSEWRRTGFPSLVPTPNASNQSKQIPRRFKYPSVEYGYNADNIQTAAARFDHGDNDHSHVWWNK